MSEGRKKKRRRKERKIREIKRSWRK